MKVTICIGSACHLKGSREIIEKLQKLVLQRQLRPRCMRNCGGSALFFKT